MREKTVETVLDKLREYKDQKKIHLPADYSVENAMKSAWLKIQDVKDKNKRPAYEVCTTGSMANSLLSMAIQGLNPDKNQCYFIVYGRTLELYRSYLGSIVVAMRVNPTIKHIYSVTIYAKDQCEWHFSNGVRIFDEHRQSFESLLDNRVAGAYAVAVDKDDNQIFTELMLMHQLKEAWAQSRAKPITESGELKEGSVHARFTDEMARKTVTQRLCKRIIGSSNDRSLLVQKARESDEVIARTESQNLIEMDANKGEVIDIGPRKPEFQAPIEDEAPPEPEPDPAPDHGGDEPMTDEEKAEIEAEEARLAEGKPPF
jgi:recombination protein RecT